MFPLFTPPPTAGIDAYIAALLRPTPAISRPAAAPPPPTTGQGDSGGGIVTGNPGSTPGRVPGSDRQPKPPHSNHPPRPPATHNRSLLDHFLNLLRPRLASMQHARPAWPGSRYPFGSGMRPPGTSSA